MLQRAIRAPWQCLADGCHPDRDTLAAIEAAGFERVEYERFRVPVPIVSPHVAGPDDFVLLVPCCRCEVEDFRVGAEDCELHNSTGTGRIDSTKLKTLLS